MEESNLVQDSTINPIQQPVQPVESQTTQSIPLVGKSKLPMMLIIFIFIVVLFSGAYYLLNQSKNANQRKQTSIVPTIAQSSPTPTIDETASPDSIGANWKTYTNNQLGFSLKYPPLWSFENEKTPNAFPPGTDAISQTTINFGKVSDIDPAGQKVSPYIPSSYLTLSIVTHSSDPTLSLNKYIEGLISPKITNIIVNNIPAKRIEHQMCQSGNCLEVVLVKNNLAITFFTQNPSVFNKEFDQILSTFRFAN